MNWLRGQDLNLGPSGYEPASLHSARSSQRISCHEVALYSEQRAGDLNSCYDSASANAGVRFKETLQLSVLAGWHREWASGNHTLLLLGRIEDELAYANPAFSTLLLARNGVGAVFAVAKPAQPIRPGRRPAARLAAAGRGPCAHRPPSPPSASRPNHTDHDPNPANGTEAGAMNLPMRHGFRRDKGIVPTVHNCQSALTELHRAVSTRHELNLNRG